MTQAARSAQDRRKLREADAIVGEQDLFLFNEGTHYRLFDVLGAHPAQKDGREGVHFAVWAPGADYAAVIGNFNGWDPGAAPMEAVGNSGIWRAFVPGIGTHEVYKYHITAPGGFKGEKSDPFAFQAEIAPKTGSVIADRGYGWSDDGWMASRHERQRLSSPISIYEMHIGSWKHKAHGHSLSYTELAEELPAYLTERGFTHVEFLPIMEHPLYASWGYQTTGYFAPTSRFGTPADFKALVDALHRAGVGVILDWVPSHFPEDAHGLARFDGSHLYEHADPRQGFHPDWKSAIFNYGRHEVRSFLISSAVYWLEEFHADALRVDAVASMLYLDYSRSEGEWIPNKHGGRENLEAIDFLQRLNAEVYRAFPDTQTFAEESTAWPKVSRPVWDGGLGFGFKWDMGWMNDTLRHLERDPIHRRFHHNELTFRGMYMHAEHYTLPLSHDEVVHGKGSLVNKMAGDDWQRFANLRLLLANQWLQPGKKLLFMGGEIAQRAEWNQDAQLEWHLLEHEPHRGVQRTVEALNRLYRGEPAMHLLDTDPAGFEWLDADDADRGLISWIRSSGRPGEELVVLLNTTPVVQHNVRLGVPAAGVWREVFNSDRLDLGGSGVTNTDRPANPVPAHRQPASIMLMAPPLSAVVLRRVAGEG